MKEMPDLFDVVELIVDITEQGLRAGMRGGGSSKTANSNK